MNPQRFLVLDNHAYFLHHDAILVAPQDVAGCYHFDDVAAELSPDAFRSFEAYRQFANAVRTALKLELPK